MQKPSFDSSRRNLLKAGLAAPLALSGVAHAALAPAAETSPSLALEPQPQAAILPLRPLGKTGIEIPMLAIGGAMANHSVEFLEAAWDRGIRYFDTAEFYAPQNTNGKSEENIGAFFAKYPERRKDIFLATKKMFMKQQPEILLENIDVRLEKCGTQYIDLFFMHAMDTIPDAYGEESLDWPRGERVREIARKLKESGKIKYFGFSTHCARKAEYLQAAAEGGWVDAILVAYNPMTDMDPAGDFSKALDACHKAGIGLIAMKTMRSMPNMPPRLPEFDALGLSSHQAVLHAALSDSRFSSVYSQMESNAQLDENTQATRSFKDPLKPEQIERLRVVAQAAGHTMCPSCDGRCGRAAGTELALADIARYVTYYERSGMLKARDMYQALPAQRRALEAGVNLEAARHACPNQLDFAAILKRAEHYFA